jgi:hypothetical protein
MEQEVPRFMGANYLLETPLLLNEKGLGDEEDKKKRHQRHLFSLIET